LHSGDPRKSTRATSIIVRVVSAADAAVSGAWDTAELGTLVLTFLSIAASSIEKAFGLHQWHPFLREKCDQPACFKRNSKTRNRADR
jgi:hypothetical protein